MQYVTRSKRLAELRVEFVEKSLQGHINPFSDLDNAQSLPEIEQALPACMEEIRSIETLRSDIQKRNLCAWFAMECRRLDEEAANDL